LAEAMKWFESAIAEDPNCQIARENLKIYEEEKLDHSITELKLVTEKQLKRLKANKVKCKSILAEGGECEV